MDEFEFDDQKSLRSPRSPRSPETPRAALHRSDIGWSPAQYDPYESPYGESGEGSPLPSPSSSGEAFHRPVATHLTQVEHPNLAHDAMEASIHEYEEFELKDSESPYASEPQGIVEELPPQAHDGFNYVQVPPNLVHRAATTSNEGGAIQGVYYPAPVPAQLRLPPLLSSSNRNRKTLPARKPRPRSILMMNVPLEPEWEPSPIDYELVGRSDEELSDADSMMVESDHSSYAASMMSSSYQEGVERVAQRSSSGVLAQNRGWFSRVMHGVIGKPGDVDNTDSELVQEQTEIVDKFDTAGFTRFDPELIREEAKRFEVGGVYSGARPSSGRPTTLIEEIEIRKAGRLAQQRNMKLDADYIKSNLQAQNRFAHPLDKEHQPTLMDLQRIAETDYNDRKQWHHLATTKQRIERGEETLADRRARRRAQKQQPEVERPSETLAERRARRKAEKEYREGLIVRAQTQPEATRDSESLVESLSG